MKNEMYALIDIEFILDLHLGTRRRFSAFCTANDFLADVANNLRDDETATFLCDIRWENHLNHKLSVEVFPSFCDSSFLQHAIQSDIQRCIFHANNPSSQDELEKLVLLPSWQMEELFRDPEEEQRLITILLKAEGLSAPDYMISKTRFKYAIQNTMATVPEMKTISGKATEFISFIKSLPFRSDSFKSEAIKYGKKYFLEATSAAKEKDADNIHRAISDVVGFTKTIQKESIFKDERQTYIGQRMYSMFPADKDEFRAYYVNPMQENMVMKFQSRLKHVRSASIRKPTSAQWLFASIYNNRLKEEMTLPESVRSHKNVSLKAARDLFRIGKNEREISKILSTADPYSVNTVGFIKDVIRESRKI